MIDLEEIASLIASINNQEKIIADENNMYNQPFKARVINARNKNLKKLREVVKAI